MLHDDYRNACEDVADDENPYVEWGLIPELRDHALWNELSGFGKAIAECKGVTPDQRAEGLYWMVYGLYHMTPHYNGHVSLGEYLTAWFVANGHLYSEPVRHLFVDLYRREMEPTARRLKHQHTYVWEA